MRKKIKIMKRNKNELKNKKGKEIKMKLKNI